MEQKINLSVDVMEEIHGCYQDVNLMFPKLNEGLKVKNMKWTGYVHAKRSPESRVKTKSDFSESGPFNEMVVMGVLAVRLQGLNKELEWNGEKMEFTNIGAEDKVRLTISDNFTIIDGDPKFDRPNLTLNAKEFAAEMVKHTYRKGYSLPDMPA